jgi:integrase
VKLTIGGRRERTTIGAYPVVTLAEARKRATHYAAAARDGLSATTVDARQRARNLTVSDAHDDYLVEVGKALRPTTLSLKRQMGRDHIAPTIGKRTLSAIRKADVIETVTAVAAKGLPVQANRVFAEIMAFLRWAEAKDYVVGVPAIRRKDMQRLGAAREKPRARTLTDIELAEVWRASGEVGDTSSDFLRLLALTGQRRDEVRLMAWDEIDLRAGMWTIPADRYKTKVDHAVPLSGPVLDILGRRHGQDARGYVLQGREGDKPFNGAQAAHRRLVGLIPQVNAFTLHDLRRTCRTGLSRLGVDEETAERVIGHLPQGITRVYDMHARLEERRAALEKWAAFVTRLSVPGANVVKLMRP